MSEAIVIRSHRARSTGTTVDVVRRTNAGSIEFDVICRGHDGVPHGGIKASQTRDQARLEATHPELWCEHCQPRSTVIAQEQSASNDRLAKLIEADIQRVVRDSRVEPAGWWEGRERGSW
jgi:hypothetical protein